ncbi:hypothetical protein CCHR01_19574 [Colletotrichum chrysophilum]|uniref:Uncharacterized protein n=1 Tax=Colletotrichum chrysophilum TaxID=1836956 RepID=A0AAD8ZY23_9PEZI|nr:hypothetical protein CCHR01_19574 [Colletotrichum chrysophilum]
MSLIEDVQGGIWRYIVLHRITFDVDKMLFGLPSVE